MTQALPPSFIPGLPPSLPASLTPGLITGPVSDETPFSAVYAAVLQQSDNVINAEKVLAEQEKVALVNSKKQVLEYETQQDTSPFAMMFAGMVKALQSVSQLEHKTNDLIEKFVARKASVEEVSMATAQLNVSITLVTTVVSSLSQSIKELQNMQV